jgi:O-antigen/teichoic acid export membrane protein
MSTQDSLRKIAKGGMILFVGAFASKFLGYIYKVIIARIGVEPYGLFTTALAIQGLLITLTAMGLNEGIQRYVSFYKGRENYRKIKGVLLFSLKSGIILGLLSSLSMFIFADYLAISVFDAPGLSILLKILAIAIPLEVVGGYLLSFFRGIQKIDLFVYIKNIGENISRVAFSALFVFIGAGIFGIALAHLIAVFITLFLGLIFLRYQKAIDRKLESDSEPSKLLKYSLPLVLSSIMIHLITWTDSLMLGSLRNIFDVGIYNSAIPLAFLIQFIPSTLMIIFFPVITELYSQKKNVELNNVHRSVTKWIFFSNIILLSIFYLFPKEIIGFVFGQDYILPMVNLFGFEFAVASVVLILVSTGFFSAILLTTSHRVLMTKKYTGYIFVAITLAAFINIGLNYLFIPKFGVIGAALATSLTYSFEFFAWFMGGILVTRSIVFEFSYLKSLFSAIIGFFIIKFLSSMLGVGNIFALLAYCIFFVLIYIIILFLLRPFDKEDKYIIELVRNKLGLNFKFFDFLDKL